MTLGNRQDCGKGCESSFGEFPPSKMGRLALALRACPCTEQDSTLQRRPRLSIDPGANFLKPSVLSNRSSPVTDLTDCP